MLAVAFGALAPTLAQAVVAGGAAPEGAVMVCTASGMLWVQADGDVLSDEGSSTLADLKKPCTWCSMHAVAAPPAMQAALPLLRCAQDMPVAFYRAGPRPAVWLGALTRAPPALRG
jgi:hypothetical protein